MDSFNFHKLGLLLAAAPIGFYFTSFGLWKLARDAEMAKNPGLPEFEEINKTRERREGTFVVCGGSIAGLLAARIASEFYERVIIVEAEAWLATEDARGLCGWEQPHVRARIIQDRSLQAVQAMFFLGLSKLFPGVESEALKSDIRVGIADWKLNFGGTKLMDAPGLPKTLYTSRSGLETLIRRMVFSKGLYPNIEQMAGTITGVIPDSKDHSRIAKVAIRTEGGATVEMDADLVADCTGLTRGGIKWLERAGYGPIPKVLLDQHLHYLTMVLDISTVPGLGDRLPIPIPGPVHLTFLEDDISRGKQYFIIMRQDSKRLLLFVGRNSELPDIKGLDDILDFVNGTIAFRDPIPNWVFDLIEVLREVENTATISKVRVPATTYVQYHKAANLPSNFVALGDSVMSVNPTLGQGCCKALMGAMALNHNLRTAKTYMKNLPANFSKRFFAEQAAKNQGYWDGTRMMDYALPTTIPIEGESLSEGAHLRGYLRRVQFLALTDEEASTAFYYNVHGLGTVIDYFRPSLILKVLWNKITMPTLE